MRVDSGERRRVTEHDAMAPAWSPDGRRIAFWGLRESRFQRDLWSVAADGSELAESAAVALLDDPALDWAPVYSGDGRWLYFASTRGGTFNLWRLAIDPASGNLWVTGTPRAPARLGLALAQGCCARLASARTDARPLCDLL